MLNAEAIYEAIKSNKHAYRAFGIRTCSGSYAIGDELAPSYNWDAEKDTEDWELLNGTCATGFGYLYMDDNDKEDDMETIHEAISIHGKYLGTGSHTYLIGSKYGSEYGNDEAEEILQYAEVVAILR